jgi:hypothetical protein
MPVTIKRRVWDVDENGVACIIVPGIPAQVVTLVPSTQMDREITRQTERKDRLATQLISAQADFDTCEAIVTDLTALRATVTAEP